MNKREIIELLKMHHAEFQHQLGLLQETDYLSAPIGKWNAGQQLDHICRSIGPVDMAFGLPVFVLRLFFGKANRASRSYEELVEKYKVKLAEGGRASKQFIPKESEWPARQKLLDRLTRSVESLSRKIEKTSESQLDTYILPHPLLGKLTLREMLYFTIHHVQHHQSFVVKNLE